MELYCYSVKSFTLSLVETYLTLKKNAACTEIEELLSIGGHEYTWKHEEYLVERSVQCYLVLDSIAAVADFLKERGKNLRVKSFLVVCTL